MRNTQSYNTTTPLFFDIQEQLSWAIPSEVSLLA